MKKDEPILIGDVFKELVIKGGLEEGLKKISIYDVWDEVVGEKGASVTVHKFYDKGILYCTISSSVYRNQLYFALNDIIQAVNSKFDDDPVKKIILK